MKKLINHSTLIITLYELEEVVRNYYLVEYFKTRQWFQKLRKFRINNVNTLLTQQITMLDTIYPQIDPV